MQLLESLQANGIQLHVEGTNLIVGPKRRVTEDMRSALRAAKPALLRVPVALVAAINRTCDLRGDDDANRAALISECLALSFHEQTDMLAHFTIEAARWESARRGVLP